MLTKCSSALLLSDVKSFADNYKRIAEEAKVTFRTEDSWRSSFRIPEEIVILGSKYIDDINKAYYEKAVLLLKEDEYPVRFMEMGITRFIFNYKDNRELALALYRPEKTVVHSSSLDVKRILKDSSCTRFQSGDYDFRFDLNQFSYKGRPLYLNDSAKVYLADWLLYGNKDNARRQILCKLRRKFGKDFMRDIDRYGGMKE